MSHRNSTLIDYITSYIRSNFSVRPDTLDNLATTVRLAVIELQKQNLFPESTITFTSEDMKEEKYDSDDEVIYSYYELPADFRQLYNNGPAFEVLEKEDKHYKFRDYTKFIRIFKSTSEHIFTLQRFRDENVDRNRIIPVPFPEDTDTVYITYYSNGVDMLMDDIDEEYYMPVINHVLFQLGLKTENSYQNDVNEIKSNRQSPAGQGSHHDSFTKTIPRFFGKHDR